MYWPASSTGYLAIIIIEASTGAVIKFYQVTMKTNVNNCDNYGYGPGYCYVFQDELLFSSTG